MSSGIIDEYGIKSPLSQNALSEAMPFNLMFECELGPEGKNVGFLRPETAQGVYINFNRLLDNASLPFAVAQVGSAFRNEIKPANGLVRCREFQLAEIQHFFDPKSPPTQKLLKSNMNDLVLPIWSSIDQEAGKGISAKKVSDLEDVPEIVLWYLAKTFQFLTSIGIDQSKIRFRQHLGSVLNMYIFIRLTKRTGI